MSVPERVACHRARLRVQGLRPIEVWVPDVNRPGFAEEVHRQAVIINQSDQREDIMDWIDSVSVDWDDESIET